MLSSAERADDREEGVVEHEALGAEGPATCREVGLLSVRWGARDGPGSRPRGLVTAKPGAGMMHMDAILGLTVLAGSATLSRSHAPAPHHTHTLPLFPPAFLPEWKRGSVPCRPTTGLWHASIVWHHGMERIDAVLDAIHDADVHVLRVEPFEIRNAKGRADGGRVSLAKAPPRRRSPASWNGSTIAASRGSRMRDKENVRRRGCERRSRTSNAWKPTTPTFSRSTIRSRSRLGRA